MYNQSTPSVQFSSVQPLTDPRVPSWSIDDSAQTQAPFGAGYAIVQGQPDSYPPPTHLIKSATLPAHTSSQQDELIALTQALSLAKDQKINIYTDSKYVYNILHSNNLKREEIPHSEGHTYSQCLFYFWSHPCSSAPKTSCGNTLPETSAT